MRRWSVRESLEFYKKNGYDGVFITNHFLDGNIGIDNPDLPYDEKLRFYFADYDEGLKICDEIGIKVFMGVELSYLGTDFLIYGPDKDFYFRNPQIMDMKKSEELKFFKENGALVIQAHPFREAGYIDHIRLFPRCVHGVEVINAGRTDFENKMAQIYAENYELILFAGSDRHSGTSPKLAGMCSDMSVKDVQDFVSRVKNREMEIFSCQI